MGLNYYHLKFSSFWSVLTRSLVVVAAFLVAACTHGYSGRTDSHDFNDHGTGVLVISGATGGSFSQTWQNVRKMQKRGVLFVVDGTCASACTLVLDHDYDNVCWTDKADFQFHAAYSRAGGPGTSEGARIATFLTVGNLPQYVRDRLPPAQTWTRWTWFSVKAEDLPESGHCRNNYRYLNLERDRNGNVVLDAVDPNWTDTTEEPTLPVTDQEFLENVVRGLKVAPELKAETAKELRPHLRDEIETLVKEARDRMS